MTENKKIMAKNITNLMIQNNVTATDICKALNIKQNTFSDWVNAKTYPRIDRIEEMANYFHVPKFMLVEDVSQMKLHTKEEEEILSEYRNANNEIKRAVCAVLGIRRESD